ncbi:MAG: AMP-binding protein [Proteobacteria bacterium]|nr:AMP-binding protein [Pseudomonadota bacterium]
MNQRDDAEFTPWPESEAARYRRAGIWRGIALAEAVHATAVRTPYAPAVSYRGRTLTHIELYRRAAELATGFSNLGLASGDRVVLQLANDDLFVPALLGLLRLGVVPVLALPSHRHAEITAYCRMTSARAYIAQLGESRAHVGETAQRVVDACPELQHIVMCPAAPDDAGPPYVSLSSLVGGPVDFPAVESGATGLLLLSGGSTGTPKLIPRTHDDYLYSIHASIEVCDFTHETVYLAVLPMGHNFTLSSPGILGTLVAGGHVVVSPSPAPSVAWPLIEEHEVTVTALVPSLLAMWLRTSEADTRERLRSLRTLQVGGARLDPDTARQVFDTLGCQLQQVYGMAEGLVCYTRTDDSIETICQTQGRPMSPHDELLVVDDLGSPVPPGHVGELLTRGPYTIRGYYRAAAHNAEAFSDQGYYRTGDLVRLTDSGHVVVVGRSKDQINRGGEKIAAPEIERHLCEHTSVEAAALVAMPDDVLGERACAYVVSTDPRLSLPALRGFLRERGLADHKLPDDLRLLKALPLTGVGKVDKRALQQLNVTGERP